MKDIHEVLRQKQAKYAALGKQIEMLQQAAEKLREVAPLLAENDDEDNAVLAEVDDASETMAAKAGAGASGASASKGARPTAPRWRTSGCRSARHRPCTGAMRAPPTSSGRS